MRLSNWTGAWTAAIAFAAAAAISAQSTPSQQNTTAGADRQQITVTGCLKQVSATPDNTTAGTTGSTAAGATGTTGTAGATAAGSDTSATPKFMLTNAASSSAGAAATTTAPGASSSASAGQSYRLLANPAALSEHVGKKLELTGTIEDQGSAASSETSAQSGANAPLLRVMSGKVVASSCSQ